MPGSLTLVRIMKSTLATLLLLGLLGATAAAAQATNGTIKAIKGGDRKLGEASNRTYALPVAGARFEYTSSETKAEDPASSGWTAFPSTTGADGTATVSVQAGTYYVREQAVPGGFSGFGPVKRLFHDPSSGVPATAKPYVAKVVVEHGQVTEAYPNRSGSGDADDSSSTSGGDTGSPFVGVRDNATFPSSCGINMLMVLDRSGSIAPYKSAYRDAARAFVGALDGTPTQIGILSFSAGDGGVSSYQDGSGSASRTHSPLDLGVAGNTATLKGTIDSVYDSPGGGTNWDRALQKASQAKGFVNNAGTGQTTNPDVVVFITDGNPTARSTDGSDSGSGIDLIDLTAGMASANVVKSQSARAGKKLKLYALGVGSGVTPGNLAAVSGPVAGEDYETPTIAELTAKLTELAARTCGARVFVRKRLAGNGADQPDWGFSATSNGGAIGYLDGDRRTHASTSGAIETGVLLTQLPAGGREVTVTEDAAGQPLGDFNLDGVACRTGGYDGAAVVPAATTAMGVKLSVQRGSTIYCTFTNSPKAPKLGVVKTPDDQTIDAGQDAEFAIVVTNTGSGTARDVALSDTLPSAGSWTISANPGGCSIAGGVLSCAFGDVPAGASRTVKVKTATSNEACAVYVNPAATASATNAATASDGGRITCRKDAKVTVVKQLAPTSDAGRFDLKVGGAVVAANVGDGGQGSAFVDPGTHAVSETGAGATDLAAYDKSIACVKNGVPAESGGGASLDITVGYGDVVVCTIANKRLPAGIGVVKDGPRFAYPGDTATFAFAVTNRGSAPLTDVVVTDDRCAPVTRSSGDELLDPGETWIFTCSKQIPPGHRIGDENPIRNVATATGEDPLGQTLTAQDDHVVHVLHPAVDIDKSGPATAVLGTALAYTLTVTNPGDVPFASQQVVVTDPRCEAPPAGPSTGGDATPGQLDPGEAWTYTCTAQTTGQPAGTFVNTATVTAKDFNGRPVTDSDDFRTMLETQQVLAGPAIANGSARLRGPSGCVRTRFRATVRGSRIAQVTFYRDGKRIKRIVAKPGQRAFTVKLEPARAQGVHRITAKVRFDGGSGTRTRTLRLSYQRCRKQVVRPRFTG